MQRLTEAVGEIADVEIVPTSSVFADDIVVVAAIVVVVLVVTTSSPTLQSVSRYFTPPADIPMTMLLSQKSI